MPRTEDLPYRPCAGMAVLDRSGRVLIGRRVEGPEHVDEAHAWQMPQGGIEPGETPAEAALRELKEEIGTDKAEVLREMDEWLAYDLPSHLLGVALHGRYRGQKQKWYAFRFAGPESEIDIEHPAGGHEPEFVEYRWEPMANLPNLVVPFKRTVYERVAREFSKFAK